MKLPYLIPMTLLFVLMLACRPSQAVAQTQSLPDDPSTKRVEKVHKRDFLYLFSEAYLSGGTTLDMKSTVDGLDHPTTANRANGTFLMHYYAIENGWAGIFGKRNTSGVVTANVFANVGLDLLGKRLYRRGGRWRIAAISLNVLKGTGNWIDGFHNIQVNRSVDKRVELETGYKGRIIWTR